MRDALVFFLIAAFFNALPAQESISDPEVKGIWYTPDQTTEPSFEWQAQWVWLNEETEADIMLARRSFDLQTTPKKAQLRITATSQYQLYVNGKYVCRGPARSAPHHQSYDILEMSKWLREGSNTLAVRVHHQKGKHSYHHDGRAGLLAQLTIMVNGKNEQILTDDNWSVSPDPAWNKEALRISRFQLVVNDKVDLKKGIANWYKPDFDDGQWSKAKPLMRNVGWPGPQKNARPQALTPPWTSLIPRDVPYLLEVEKQASDLIEAIQIEGFPVQLSKRLAQHISRDIPGYQRGEKPLIIPASGTTEKWLLLFDLGKVLNGNAQLHVQGPAGTKVDILSAPFIVDNKFNYHVVDSDFKDQITLSGGKDYWEATYFKPTRYLGILIESGNEPVKLHHIGIRHTAYPFRQTGSMYSSDAPWVERYMEAAAKTIQVCTTDGYTDNYRERRQYAQTGYYAALGNYWLFGDHALQRRYLVQVAQEQEANGMMPAYAPLSQDDYMIIMDSNCLWVRSLRNYFLHSGDIKTVKELLPAAKKLMDLLHGYTNTLGFIYNPPYPYWLDHALNDRRGANLNLNGHYLGALEDFAEVLNWLGEPGREKYRARAYLLRQSLQEQLWDEEKGLFADAWINGKRSDQFSEHANAMALALNVATREQAESVAGQLLAADEHNFIKRANGMTIVTPAMSYFLHKGLCHYGYVDESFQMFRQRFEHMLAPNTNGTLWEEWWLDGTGRSGKFQGGRTRSDAQTESAFPPALFGEYLLGVHPVKPGWKEVEIYQPESDIQQIEAIIPSAEGELQVKWYLDQNFGGSLALEIPGEMRVKINIASLRRDAKQNILVNGRKVRTGKKSDSFITLSRGKHVLSF